MLALNKTVAAGVLPSPTTKISVNTSLIAHLLLTVTPSNVFRPAMTLHGLAAGVTATFVTALVPMDCMKAFHHVVGL